MRLTAILIERQLEQSRQILKESCYGLDSEQRRVVEGIYNEFLPLIEASLTADQITQIFGTVEKSATAAGGNRTLLGKAADVPGQVNDIINKAGKWLQDTTPVKMFDQKFEDLKGKVAAKFPELADKAAGLGEWVKANPGKSAAVIGILTTLAALAGGPVGGAIAGQVLRGAAELLKGEKLSTAVGKGIKTAAYGFIAGKTFELLGDAIKGGAQVVKDTLFPNALRLNMNSIFDEVGGELGTRWANFEIKGLVGTPEDINTAKKLFSGASQAWKAGNYEQSAATWKSLEGMIANTFNDPTYIAQIASDQASRTMISQAAQAAQEATKYLGAAAQGAVAAAGSADGKKESVHKFQRPLSEGQVYLVFDRVIKLNEGPVWDKVKGVASNAVGAVAQKAGQIGTNLTTKVTADKLNSAWKKAGSPMDSEEVAKILTAAGVGDDIVKTVYTDLKIPAPGSAPAAASIDIEQIKKIIAALPTDRKVRLLKFMQKNTAAAPAQG
jgi:hypothetical protein